ncbi:MAG: hypothetical protein PHP65_06090 [Bacilli bacterium]|nr:hypothetical protein [Bacilli bacterium]
MKVYKFRVLNTEDEEFLREYELTENQSLLDFHNLITKNLKLNQEELASFFITNSNWEKEHEYTLLDMGLNPDEDNNRDNSIPIEMMEDALIDSIASKPKQKLLYEYNFMNPIIFYITLIGERAGNSNEVFPKCVVSEGILDVEQSLSYLSDFDDFDEFSQEYSKMPDKDIDLEDLEFDDEDDDDIFGDGGGYESDYY